MLPQITIIALNKLTYGMLAVNLAATLKAANYGVKVAVITNMDLSKIEGHELFDETVSTTITNPFLAKAQAYKLTPWKETFVVDADSLCLWKWQDIEALCSLVSDCDLSFPVLGRFSQQDKAPLSWVSLRAIWEAAELGKSDTYPAVYSGLFYFRKSRKAAEFFKAVAKAYGTYPVGTYHGHHPDEPYFSAIAAKKGYQFGELDGTVCKAEGPCNETNALNNHYFLTLPGQPSREWKRLYNAVVNNTKRIMGVGYGWQK
jgi:hypothetical protein